MRIRLVVSTVVLALAVPGLALGADMSADEKALRQKDAEWAKAFTARDAAAVTAYYADDAVLMDPGPALEFKGKANIRKSFEDFFANAESITFKALEQDYHVAGNFAYVDSVWEGSFKNTKTGATTSMKGRALTVFQKRGGKWLAVADHASVPVPAEEPAKP